MWKRIGFKKDSLPKFNILNQAYDSPKRKHHNWNHIVMGLDEFQYVKDESSNPEAVEFAWFYHDFYFNPAANDDEIVSAEYAGEVVQLGGASVAFEKQVYDLVKITDHKSDPKTIDEKIICGLDLMILGMPPERYNQYVKNVYEEYKMVLGTENPEAFDVKWNEGRSVVLRHFLERENIFNHNYFNTQYEDQARDNLANELARLTKH